MAGTSESAVAAVSAIVVLLVAFALRPRTTFKRDRWFLVVAAVSLGTALAPTPWAVNVLALLATLVSFLALPSPHQHKDPKTGALTREGIRSVLANQLAGNGAIACLAVATDRYEDLRMINGDETMCVVMREMANSLKEACPRCAVAYLGRGRFLVAGDSSFNPNAAQVEVADRFKLGWTVGDRTLPITARSVAVPSTNRLTDSSTVLDTVESAMDRMLLSDSLVITMDEHALERIGEQARIRRVLEHALDTHTLEVHYQPLYNTKLKRPTRAEALARLRDDDGSYIPPDVFIAIAESSGAIDRLGEQIFEQVCAFSSHIDFDALGLECINVNLSPLQCMSRELPQRLRAIAERYGVSMERLHLEITESAMVDISILQEQMGVLVSTGSQFSLDDYGTGYSSITRVATLPFTNIKLDHSLVWNYFEGKSDMLPNVISTFLAHGLEICAEGVETKEMAQALEEMGCDLLQGFYFSRPLPAEEFVSFLRKNGGTTRD